MPNLAAQPKFPFPIIKKTTQKPVFVIPLT